ncbi:MAG TPA: YIP1 family protein [Dehalococcoidia bacterium]|nr:YIP1 family protein [Dehalococcoidia bacterium]
MDPQLIFRQVIRCILLDADTYEEIRTNIAETVPGVLVVIIASYVAGLGGLIWTFTAAQYADHFRFLVRSFVLGSAIQPLVFFLWVLVTSLVLMRVFRVPARYPELLRVMSFAFAPVALQILIFIPAFDQPIGIIALAAALYVATFAVQTSTIATPGQAFVSCAVGFAVFCLILGLLGNGATDFAPGIFALDPNSLSVGSTLQLPSVPR